MDFLKTYKKLLINSLNEHKKIIIILYAFFIIVFITAWLLYPQETAKTLLSTANTTETPQLGNVNPVSIFINNEFGGLVTYFSSVLFAIPSIVILGYNALNLGGIGALFSAMGGKFGIQYIFYLIPHGIFEITATVLESTAGILLFTFIWKFIKNLIKSKCEGLRSKLSESFENSKNPLIQSIALMIFTCILLLIAALIESYISVPFSQFIVSIL